ncbi:MAG: hypothetical protein ACOX83_09305 [Candidatus Spyradocola sp.]|jgi:hypothetical protein
MRKSLHRVCLAGLALAILLLGGCSAGPSAESRALAERVFCEEGPYALLFAYSTEAQGAEALARESEDFAALLTREDAEAALLVVAAESDDALVRRAVRIALDALP